jgi:tRNA(Arg) A34 adenosine deaminase TadA
MDFAILLAKKNIEHQTGGPFGAAIFDMDTQQLIAVGVNVVVPSHCSNNHAEMVAITLAQQTLKSYTLNADSLPKCELVSSCEPCAMCFGAIPWSGIRHLSYGATAADAEAIGFDEGPKHPGWTHELEKRGISIDAERNRDAAVELFKTYQQQNGTIYNA